METLTDDLLGTLICWLNVGTLIPIFHSNKRLHTTITRLLVDCNSVTVELVCNSLSIDEDFLESVEVPWNNIVLLSLKNRVGCLLYTLTKCNYFGFVEAFMKLPLQNNVLEDLIRLNGDRIKFSLLNSIRSPIEITRITPLLVNGYYDGVMHLFQSKAVIRGEPYDIVRFIRGFIRGASSRQKGQILHGLSSRQLIYSVVKTKDSFIIYVTQYIDVTFEESVLIDAYRNYYMHNEMEECASPELIFVNSIECKEKLIENIKLYPDVVLKTSILKAIVTRWHLFNDVLEELYCIPAARPVMEKLANRYTSLDKFLHRKRANDEEISRQNINSLSSCHNVEILTALKREGLKLSTISEDVLLEMILTAPEDFKLFSIFNDEVEVEINLLQKYGEIFTSQTLIGLGFRLSSLLKVAGVQSRQSDEILEELMYLEISDNLRDAIMYHLLS